MAFPAVPTTAVATTAESATSIAATLPASISSGDLLIVAVVHRTVTGMTWPAGWTAITNAAGNDSIGVIRVEARYRVADGTEGASITVSADAGGWVSRAWRITGHNSTAPECAATGGNSTNANPPSLTPSWGAKDTLWLAYAGKDNINVPTGFPTNYSGTQQTSNSTGTGPWVAQGSAFRELNATSDDPGTFTSEDEQWRALTVAVEPSGSASVVPVLMAEYRQRRN